MTKEDKIMIKGIFCTLMRAIISIKFYEDSDHCHFDSPPFSPGLRNLLKKDYDSMAQNLENWIKREER